MKKLNVFIIAIASSLMFSGCASIVSKSTYPVSINSNPASSISVVDSRGTEIFKGGTPATVTLKAGDGFFKRATYQVKFVKDGYDEKIVPITFKVDGWYWANILLGGVIGMLIVDPATGAMYKLENEFMNETLTRNVASNSINDLTILGLEEIPFSWKSHLVLLKEQ
jgi:uncharacterized protein YceK